MPVDPDKRRLREQKRAVKKRGNKHRRQQLKRDLAENPDEAAHSDEDLGRHRSDALNGLSDAEAGRRLEQYGPNRLKSAPETKRIPVIALTSHAMVGEREKALAAGCDDFDTKPVHFTRLLEKIRALLPQGSAS